MSAAGGQLAVSLGGGAARGAYQVGVLRHVALRYPTLRLPILTGVSAGAINAAFLANHGGTLGEKVDDLTALWSRLTVDQVFRVSTVSLLRQVVSWAWQVTLPKPRRAMGRVRGFVETQPLRQLLLRAFHSSDGTLPGIGRNLASGVLDAVAVTTTSYMTGQTITFVEGGAIEAWERPMRRGIRTRLRVEHVMASSALPLFFPAVRIGEDWHGDGGIRLHSPLAPAAHLGAGRILAVSTIQLPTAAEADVPAVRGYPPPAQILGVLYDAVFLDLLDQDALQLERINRLLAVAGRPVAEPLRRIALHVVRPSRDLGALAAAYEPRLPRPFRFLMRRLGTRETSTPGLLSMVMFQPDYLTRLIELGERDAAARQDEIAALLEA